MSEAGYAGLIAAAHHQLHAPVILIWDNLNTHVSALMRTFADAHRDWLTVVRLPAYAPDLNAAEGVWANMKNGPGNLAASNVDQLAAIVRNRLKRIQYRPALIEGFLAGTRLDLTPLSNPAIKDRVSTTTVQRQRRQPASLPHRAHKCQRAGAVPIAWTRYPRNWYISI